MVTAFAPMAFFFSAVYSESLYLALSVGVFWCARQGRWAWVGVLGALAAATRSAGVVLLLPALMLYLYGPREDRAPDFPPGAAARGRPAPRARARHRRALALAADYRLRSDILWLGLVPAGLALYMAYLALSGGDALMPFHAAGRLGQALRRALRGRVGRGQGGVRGRAPAAVLPAPARLLPGRRRQPVRSTPGTT